VRKKKYTDLKIDWDFKELDYERQSNDWLTQKTFASVQKGKFDA
jgi:hypothetical protein